MKKILSLLFLVLMLGFVACNNDDPKPGAPTITLDQAAASATPGTTATAKVTITAPGGAQTLILAGGVTNTITLDGKTTAFDQNVDVAVPANAVIGSTISVVISVTDKNNLTSSPETFTVTVGDPNPVVEISGNITANQTLVAGKNYLLKSQVFVKSGVTLTIPAGTVIKGDKVTKAALIVEPGGKLVCNGTAANPVVFTSAQPANARDRGDWAGVLILGSAWVNQETKPSIEGITPSVLYGSSKAEGATPTTNANDNSGTLTYVRIEYAGIELTPNNETNGLTLGAVGNGTTLDYIQSSYGGDDAFEWFGGTVNAKHLISFVAWDDDFDTDFGYGGNVQFGLAVRYPFSADQSGSNAFESDNQGNGNATNGCDFTVTAGQVSGNSAGCTKAVFSNMTVIGPRDISSRAISGNFQNAMHIRRRTTISIFNSVLTGFPTGLRLDEGITVDGYTAGTLGKLANNVLVSPGTVSNNLAVAKEVGTTSGEIGPVYSTNTNSGDATAVKTIWSVAANNNVTIKPTNGGTDFWTAASNPYTALGLSTSAFWGGLGGTSYPTNPSFALTSGSLATGAVYTDALLGSFFDKTGTYKGAFGTSDWTDTWTEFQPVSKAY
jgi:hypothetical protein